MRVPICPKCGTIMNGTLLTICVFDMLECPKCRFTCKPEDAAKETMYIPDDTVETRAGLEGIEAQVIV